MGQQVSGAGIPMFRPNKDTAFPVSFPRTEPVRTTPVMSWSNRAGTDGKNSLDAGPALVQPVLVGSVKTAVA
jgi:hypothetical protein